MLCRHIRNCRKNCDVYGEVVSCELGSDILVSTLCFHFALLLSRLQPVSLQGVLL